MEKKPEYISRSGLKYRGWTEKMMKLFLPPDPDEEVDNPHYKSAPPMKLYLIKQVNKIEKNQKVPEV